MLVHKQWIHSLKVLSARMIEAFSVLGRLTDKNSLLPRVPLVFLQVQKSIPSTLSERVFLVSVPVHIKCVQRKPAMHEKSSRDKISKRSFVVISDKNNLEAKVKCSGVRNRLEPSKSHYSYLH